MPQPDALLATLAVARVLEEMAIPYLVAGSLASSYHGIPRSTADADLVAALGQEHADLLDRALLDGGMSPHPPPGARGT